MKKLHKSRKGQAALEFLMTYGWAILGLMVALGALAYFGVINPTRSLPEKCMFGNSLNCRDVYISGNVLNITLVNGLGQSIYSITASPETGSFTGTCTPSAVSVVSDGELRIDCTNVVTTPPLSSGNPIKLRLKITFKKIVGGYDHVSSGEIYTLVI